jgi:hypothetical protein
VAWHRFQSRTEVREWSEKLFGEWTASLTPRDAHRIYRYSQEMSRPVNAMLWATAHGEGWEDAALHSLSRTWNRRSRLREAEEIHETLTRLFNTAPLLDRATIAFRGVTDQTELAGRQDGYLSISLQPDAAQTIATQKAALREGPPVVAKLLLPPGVPAIYVDLFNNRRSDDEDELLLPPGLRFEEESASERLAAATVGGLCLTNSVWRCVDGPKRRSSA